MIHGLVLGNMFIRNLFFFPQEWFWHLELTVIIATGTRMHAMITFRISGWGNTIGPVCVCAPRLSTLSELNRWTYWLNIHVVASAFLHRNELPTCTGNWGDFIFDIAPPAGPFFKEFDNFCLQSEVREDDMELKASHCHKIWGKHEKRNENKQTYKKVEGIRDRITISQCFFKLNF